MKIGKKEGWDFGLTGFRPEDAGLTLDQAVLFDQILAWKSRQERAKPVINFILIYGGTDPLTLTEYANTPIGTEIRTPNIAGIHSYYHKKNSSPVSVEDWETTEKVSLNAKLANIVEDTTPQLGGDLDVNGHNITSAAGLNVAIGSSAGNDFTIDIDKLVVEGDTGNVGIGTTGPGAKLSIAEKLRLFDVTPTNASASTDAGYLFGSAIPSGGFTEVSGQVLSYAINVPQAGTRDTAKTGGIFRFDTRSSENKFIIFGYPTGGSIPMERLSVSLQAGTIYMATEGGNVGIGTTTPRSKLAVVGLPTSSAELSAGDFFTQTATQLGGSGTTKVVCVV